MVAFALPIMLGAASLALEFGQALITRVEHQRTADLAAYAGALAYQQSGSQDTMRASALTVTTLNGIAATNVFVSLVASPRATGAQAVSVTMNSSQPIILGSILGAPSLTIASAAMAEIGSRSSSGCIVALDPNGSGVTMSGGTSLNAPLCTVASNATITSPCGTTIVTAQATYNSSSAPDQPQWCKTIKKQDGTPAPILKDAASDPLASNAGVQSITNRLGSLSQIGFPQTPFVASGPDLDFNPWDPAKRAALAQALAAQGCSGTYNSQWTVTCAGTHFTFGNFYVSSGVLVQFNLNGPSNAAYSFKSITSDGGGNYQFGPGSYTVAAGITLGGSMGSFGAGTFNIGPGSCGYSLCSGNSGQMTFAGPSNFQFSNGIQVNGSNVTTLGSGSGNSFSIGSSSPGTAIQLNSGSLILADIGSGAFRVVGRVSSGGGSCLVLPAAAQHDIAGSVDVSGALVLGAGPYAINGFLALGAQGGGSANCNGQSNVSLIANGVTIGLAGKELVPSGSCQGSAYCASAGYNSMILTSPTSGPYAQLAVIGPTTAVGGATLTGGAGGSTIAGAFYFPRGSITISGGASASGTPSSCLAVIGLSISISGGSAAAADCSALTEGSATPRIKLVN